MLDLLFFLWLICCFHFSGIGYTMITLSLVVAVYYNVILALTFFYFFASVYGLFVDELPWAKCGHDWNRNCLERQQHLLNGQSPSQCHHV